MCGCVCVRCVCVCVCGGVLGVCVCVVTYLIRILSSDPASYDMAMRRGLVDRTVWGWSVCIVYCVGVECVYSVLCGGGVCV